MRPALPCSRALACASTFLLLALVAGCANIIDLEERTLGGGGSCEAYCTQAQELCPGLFYQDDMGCRGVCAAYAPGDSNDPVGNTLACRMKVLQNAATFRVEANLYCPGAGTSGVSVVEGNSCGTLCDGYCDLYKTVCGEIPDCKNKCQLLPDRPGLPAMMDFSSGADTVQCRLAHVTAAATAKQLQMEPMRVLHCGHSGLKSNTLCDVNDDKVAGIEIQCADFCKLTMGACQGANQVYESPAQCEAVCSKLQPGKLAELASKADSRRCRRENAYAALVEPDPLKLREFCADASPAPAHCGPDRCSAYCALASQGCSSQFSQKFGANGIAMCEADCRTKLADQGQNFGYSLAGAAMPGQPLNCRVLRVSRALAARAVDAAIPPGTCEAALGLPPPSGGPAECQ